VTGYYPPPHHEVELCARCFTVRDNPHSLRHPQCCTDPVLYTYRRVPGMAPTRFAPPAPSPLRAPKQMTLELVPPPPQQKPERCLWCDEWHAGGPEHCGAGE